MIFNTSLSKIPHGTNLAIEIQLSTRGTAGSGNW